MLYTCFIRGRGAAVSRLSNDSQMKPPCTVQCIETVYSNQYFMSIKGLNHSSISLKE